jgi:Spy/CpxP family protein refolding chaperone
MLAQIRRLRKTIALGLLLAAAASFVSCASEKEQVALVNDPDSKKESMIPWNKQEKWETGGQLGNITDRR